MQDNHANCQKKHHHCEKITMPPKIELLDILLDFNQFTKLDIHNTYGASKVVEFYDVMTVLGIGGFRVQSLM